MKKRKKFQDNLKLIALNNSYVMRCLAPRDIGLCNQSRPKQTKLDCFLMTTSYDSSLDIGVIAVLMLLIISNGLPIAEHVTHVEEFWIAITAGYSTRVRSELHIVQNGSIFDARQYVIKPELNT